MDYYFWDEIFGGRPARGDLWREEPRPPEIDPPGERITVIIACVERYGARRPI